MRPGDKVVAVCDKCGTELVLRALILTCPKCGCAPETIQTKTIGRRPGWPQ